MNISVAPGKYVVAVSGGVDSMALLDMLSNTEGLQLVVAHFEHGIREDSDQDRELVEEAARRYALPFVFERGHLGAGASEAVAREARYVFLRRIMKERGASAIITAHHQDDLLETAVLNIVRGTGRKGLSSLHSGDDLIRPLLHLPKQAIVEYAQSNNISWREDSTNENDRYLRNYVRRTVLPRLDSSTKQQLLAYIQKAQATNPLIDDLLAEDLRQHMSEDGVDKGWFIMLPYDVSCEVMATWLRHTGVREFDRKTIQRLVVLSKVAQPGKAGDVNAEYQLKVGKTTLSLSLRSPS
jgi:tRNA(Ile)-lysidine synthetase-like protein